MTKPDLLLVIFAIVIIIEFFAFFRRRMKNLPSAWKFGNYMGVVLAFLVVIWYIVAIIVNYFGG